MDTANLKSLAANWILAAACATIWGNLDFCQHPHATAGEFMNPPLGAKAQRQLTTQEELEAKFACSFTILAVDDSPVYRKLLQESLQREECRVVLAKDGNEALRMFEQHRPAVVITDWTMPDISGPELCKRIRSDFPDVYCHLILVTSNSDKDQVIEGLHAGADDYLTKPFHPGELLARVAVGRRISELHRQIQAKNRLLEQLALTDALTGLPNRRAIEMWASHQLSAAARHHFPVSVVIADLDFFKRINDSYGHEAGDNVLRGFAEILKGNTRQSDICGRWGGEEFLLIISHAEQDNLRTAIERIRQQLESKQFTFCKVTITVTASFGIATFCGNKAPELQSIAKRADAALYTAKQRGRNRMEFASP
jgi:two-component system, cell cycle response regulator